MQADFKRASCKGSIAVLAQQQRPNHQSLSRGYAGELEARVALQRQYFGSSSTQTSQHPSPVLWTEGSSGSTHSSSSAHTDKKTSKKTQGWQRSSHSSSVALKLPTCLHLA